MKVVIFAGGFGTRISEESHLKPKPMIEIGDRPILWHIMKLYSYYGFNDFIICLGYKGSLISDYFLNYCYHNCDISVDLSKNTIEKHNTHKESFKVTLVDTGIYTKTAGRLKRIEKYLDNEDFMLTYGDGVADINIPELIKYHKKHNKIATVTSVQMPGRFGGIKIENEEEFGTVKRFKEKPLGEYWINGGFFVLKPEIFELLDENSDNIMWEEEPIQKLIDSNQLNAYCHDNFWHCLDTLRDKKDLEGMWKAGNAKWMIWQK